jgi:hypothetical protein
MRFGFLLCAAAALALAAPGSAQAGSLECNTPQDCGWMLQVNGEMQANGTFVIDEAGNVSLPDGPVQVTDPQGEWTATVGENPFDPDFPGFGGNVDPELVFGLGATNNSNAVAVFAFAFNLPLGGFGPPTIKAEAALGTTLTAPSDANATVFPVLGVGKIVDSQDFDAAFNSFDKGVDIGDRLTDPAGGVSTLRNEFVTSNILSGQGPFELMTVTVAFGLTDDSLTAGSGVGFSGRVTQIPEPGTIVLLGAGLFGLAWLRRQQT